MITLYTCQVPPFHFLVDHEGHRGIELPTGAGKTVILVAAIGRLILQGFKVLIAAPQEHIENGFTRRSYCRVRAGDEIVEVPPEIIVAARENGQIVETIRDFLESSETQPHALACTHAALTRFRPPTGVPENLEGCVLVIDEAHHGAALGLSQFITAWIAAGGRVIYASATMFRSDGEDVLLSDMEVYRISLPHLMSIGGAPRRFRSGVHALRLREAVELAVFHGDADPSEGFQRLIVRTMVQRWLEDGKPKAIVRVPSMRGGSSRMVSRIIRAFRRAHARVLDVSGTNPAAKRRFLDALVSERALNRFEQSQYDVIVGVQRVSEGMDWKFCSTVYCVGFPKHVATVAQLMGRASRKKQRAWRYPMPHRERMQIEFFVPCGNEMTVAGMPRYHAQHTLLVCAFLDDYERKRSWKVVEELSRGITVPVHGDEEVTPGRIEREMYIDNALREPVERQISSAVNHLCDLGRAATPGNIFRWVVEHHPDVPQTLLKHVLCEVIVRDEGGSLGQAKQQLMDELNAQLSEGRPLRDALIQAFNEVVDRLEENNVVTELDLNTQRLRRRVLELTGQDITRYSQELTVRRPLTPDWLTDVCRDHRIRTGGLPTGQDSGGPHGWPGETWRGIDRAIRRNDRAWPLHNINSLDDFCRLYARARGGTGTTAEVLQLVSREVGLLSAGPYRKLLNNFLSCRVRINGDPPVEIRALPAFPPAAERNRYPQFGALLNAWFGALRETATDPVTIIYGWAICERVITWLNQHRTQVRLGDAQEVGTAARREFTEAWAGTGLVFRVRSHESLLRDLRPWLYPGQTIDGRGHPFSTDQHVYAVLNRCPFSDSRGHGEIHISRRQRNRMVGSRVMQAECVPVEVPLVRVGSALRAMTVEEYPDSPAHAINDGTTTINLQVPISWFTHWISVSENGRQTSACEPVDIAGTLRRMPGILEYDS